MPFEYDPEAKLLAKALWEGGHKPIETERAMGRIHAIPVPARTISNWAKEEGWRHWKLAKAEIAGGSNPNLPFGVSGIKDPLLHDCEVIAKKYCRQEGSRSGPIKPVIAQALMVVINEKEPPQAVLDYLAKVVLRPYIINVRKNNLPSYMFDMPASTQAIIDALNE